VPAGLLEMLQIPGVGPKKVKGAARQARNQVGGELEAACKAGKVQSWTGFGEKTQTKICEASSSGGTMLRRHLVVSALKVSEPLPGNFAATSGCDPVQHGGEFAAVKEIVGTLISWFPPRSEGGHRVFCHATDVLSVSAKGETKADGIVTGGIQADLRGGKRCGFPFRSLTSPGARSTIL